MGPISFEQHKIVAAVITFQKCVSLSATTKKTLFLVISESASPRLEITFYSATFPSVQCVVGVNDLPQVGVWTSSPAPLQCC